MHFYIHPLPQGNQTVLAHHRLALCVFLICSGPAKVSADFKQSERFQPGNMDKILALADKKAKESNR
jgi:hypothetical protein